MKIDSPTYLIAELAGEVVDFVTELRKSHNPDRVVSPVDFTIAGSSGVGTIEEGQNLSEVVALLAPLIAETYFADVSFEKIQKFPNSGIFSLRPNRSPFDRVHEAIASSRVRFNATDFPFNPHCAIRAGEPLSNDEDFFNMSFPRSASIGCFSLYQPKSYGGRRIHKFEQNAARSERQALV